jgi:hypothetical protein
VSYCTECKREIESCDISQEFGIVSEDLRVSSFFHTGNAEDLLGVRNPC